MSKKIISILSMLLISVSLVGCSEANNSNLPNTQQNISATEDASSLDIPVLDAITIDFETATADGEYVKADYPSEEWTYIDTNPLTPFGLIYNDSSEDFATNISIDIPKKLPQTLQEVSKALPDELQNTAPGLIVDLCEVRKIDDEEIIYTELHTKLTDEIIDLLIQEGRITEELLEQVGGREVLKSTPETKQIMMVVEQDEKAVTITGSYQNDSEQEPVLKAMKTLLQTIDIK